MRLETFTLSLIVCATAHAELKWEQTRVDLHPAVGEKQAVGHFNYENAGKTPVRFLSVKPSCGCTTAQTQKDEVPPGGKGEITATFTLGDRTGVQTKTITVRTEDPNPATGTTVLTLQTTIPSLLEIQPGLVYWQPGEELKPKTIVVTAGKEFSVKSIKVTAGNKEFQTKVEQVADGEFKIEVQPPARTAKATGTTIAIQPDGSDKTFAATAMVSGGPVATPPASQR